MVAIKVFLLPQTTILGSHERVIKPHLRLILFLALRFFLVSLKIRSRISMAGVSVRPSVRVSVRPFIGPFVCFFVCLLSSSNSFE